MNKNIDYKKTMFSIILVLLLIILVGCFIVALINHKTVKTSSLNKSSLTITSSGTYSITGENSCIVINTNDDVNINLENATITCDNGPAINVIKARTVTINLTGENKVKATTTSELDGAIYSKEDLVFNGEGSLNITSNYDGIVSKDNLVINDGNYIINTSDDGIRGKDSVTINDGAFNITSLKDGIKATNEEENDKGYISINGGTLNINSGNDAIQAVTNLYIKEGTFNIKITDNSSDDSHKCLKADILITIDGGTFDISTTDDAIHSNGNIIVNNGNYTITSDDDAIHADGMIEINNGTFNITAHEGIEATYVKINDGLININASDDGINAGNKSNDYKTKVEINGGNITINMGAGDTDGVDSNGDIIINGGTIKVNGQSTFDYDGTGTINGGTVICNSSEVTTLPNQFMGGGMPNGGIDRNTRMPGRR